MKEYAAGVQSSDLRLVDVAAAARSEPRDGATASSAERSADAAGAPVNDDLNAAGTFAPPNGTTSVRAASAPGTADKFLTAATKEFEAGLIDQPLWKRAMDQCGGDRTAAGQAYLRARATALRVTKRDKRQERSARRARAMNELVTPADPRSASPVSESASKPAGALRSRGLRPKRGQVMWVGGALASLFVAALFVTLRSETGAAQQKDPAKPASAASGPTRIASAGSIAPRNAKADGAADAKANAQAHEALSGEDFAAKLQGLKSAGNWNMVVLYAVEWIRKQPENPEAWKELSSGYARLRQYREALDAATRVVQLSPDDATAWQTLGQLNVVLQQPVDALAAFEQALARNERDAPSMVQTGIINTQLGRFADAKLAFAKALALNSQDVEALCGAASLAQREGRPKDAEALTRQVATLDNRCRDASPGESVRVAAGAKSRTAASVVR